MRIIIDRVEGEIAVIELENGAHVNVPKKFFGEVSEGDVFLLTRDDNERDARKSKAKSLFERLTSKD